MSRETDAKDIDFLADMIYRHGSFVCDPERWWGLSANYIVALAYGRSMKQELPKDEDDLMACERMWIRLPDHRKNDMVRSAMRDARLALKPVSP